MAIFNSLLSWYFKNRIDQIDYFVRNPHEVQETWRKKLIRTAANTQFGRHYDFSSIHSLRDYQNRVPVQNYEAMHHYINRMMHGEQNVLWPTEIKWFAKSSGTTNDKSKFIPVSFETLDDCHFKGGKDVLTMYCNHFEDTEIFTGKGLVIGGSHQVNKMHEQSFYGDLSAVVLQNLPFLGEILRTPENSIALMDNWEEKIEKLAQATLNENVTSISGVPTWTMVLMEHMMQMRGAQSMKEIWPGLELYIHGGVSFVPYKNQFLKLAGKDIRFFETYNASEGFFGMQDPSTADEMYLMLDYGIYYEFMPMSEYGKEYPETVGLENVQQDVQYAIVISTNSGLWRYLVGDTIRFTSLKPYRFKITGRTKLFINAFGEELMIDNAERAIDEACRLTNSVVREYTAAPVFISDIEDARHEWLIEFETQPDNMESFKNILDQTLKQLNGDYEAKRFQDIAMKPPRIHNLKTGTFYNWLKNKGKLGGQHKVPRLSNDRKIVEEILQCDL